MIGSVSAAPTMRAGNGLRPARLLAPKPARQAVCRARMTCEAPPESDKEMQDVMKLVNSFMNVKFDDEAGRHLVEHTKRFSASDGNVQLNQMPGPIGCSEHEKLLETAFPSCFERCLDKVDSIALSDANDLAVIGVRAHEQSKMPKSFNLQYGHMSKEQMGEAPDMIDQDTESFYTIVLRREDGEWKMARFHRNCTDRKAYESASKA